MCLLVLISGFNKLWSREWTIKPLDCGIQSYLGDIAGSTPDHYNAVTISINQDMYIVFLGHNAIEHLIDYRVVSI